MPSETDKRIKMLYDPHVSLALNAIRCNVSVSTIRTWLKQNNIDRNFDAKLVRFKTIKKYQKRVPPLTAQQIAQKTGYSVNTVKKYMRIDKLEQEEKKRKVSTFDVSKNDGIIKSVSNDQQEILNWIIQLYIKEGYIECDYTFSIGVMYKDDNVIFPKYRFDKYPKQGIYEMGGVWDLKDADSFIDDGSLHSSIIDLPFLVTKREWTETSMMAQRFNSFNDMDEAEEAHKYLLELSYRKLKKGGILIMKTQDIYTEGKQLWFHRYVEDWAIEVGYKLIDMFILVADNRILIKGMSQRVARKYHSYFFVFKK